MDIEKIAQKLEPLMPDRVARWFKVREMADPEIRTLMDKQIIATAHRKLGDFRKKILLSLPPESKVRGAIDQPGNPMLQQT